MESVLHDAVVAEAFTVIGGQNDRRACIGAEQLDPLQELSDLCIDIGDLPAVRPVQILQVPSAALHRILSAS